MKELEDWLICDERRTAITGLAMFGGKKQWVCILHDFTRWVGIEKDCQIEAAKVWPVQKICYADTLEDAVFGAIRQ